MHFKDVAHSYGLSWEDMNGMSDKEIWKYVTDTMETIRADAKTYLGIDL